MGEKIIILLVDDEESFAMAEEKVILRLGYGSFVARSGEEAVQMVVNHPEISLVLMDMDLGPGINGQEAARQILALRNLPIVFLVPHPERRVAENLSNSLSFRYLKKNSTADELQASIELTVALFASLEEKRKTEELQQLILASVPTVIYTSPLDQAIDASWVSGDIEKITGFTVVEYLAEKDFWRKRLHPDDRERVLISYQNPAGDNEVINEYRWLCKDGNYKWFYDRAIKKLTPQATQYIGIILDINERKRADERLLASEVSFRRLFETAKDGILILDAVTGTIMDVNPFLTEMLGYSAEEICGKKIWDLGSFKDIVANQANFRELQQKGYLRYEDLPLESVDGRRHNVEFVSNVYSVNHKQVIQCNIRDISERKKAENIIRTRLFLVEFAAVHTLAELVQKTLDEVCALTDSPIGFYYFVDPDQITLTLQGWSTRTLQEFRTVIPKETRYTIEEAGAWVDCIRQRQPIIHNNHTALPHHQALSECHVLIRRELVVPILRENQIVAVMGIGNKKQDYTEKDIEFVTYFADVAWEITRRKQAEDMLSQANLVVENSPVVLFRWKASEDWPVALVSQNVSQFGYTQDELLSGKIPYTSIVYPEDLNRFAREVQKYSRNGTDSFHQEYRIVTKDGRIRWIEDDTVIERDSNGQPLYYQGIVLDITDRKGAEIALAEKHLRLTKALDEVRTLQGIIPICANCKQIRDDKGYWNDVEKYVAEHTHAEFSHGICPKCMKELYPEFTKSKQENKK